MKEKNNYSNYMGVLKDVFAPIFVYYLIYIFAHQGLTSIVIEILKKVIAQGTKDNMSDIIVSQEATINAVISGFSMLLGILPLIPGFRKEIKKSENKCAGRLYLSIPLTIILAAASSITINILFIKLHIIETSESYRRVSEHQYGVSFLIGLFLYGIVSPLAEEVLFRGIIYNRMKKYFLIKISMLASALLFGVYHINPVQGIYGFLMGMLIAYVYEKFGNFFYAFLFHAVANIVVYTVSSYETLYSVLITPYACVIPAMVSVGMLAVIYKIDKLSD